MKGFVIRRKGEETIKEERRKSGDVCMLWNDEIERQGKCGNKVEGSVRGRGWLDTEKKGTRNSGKKVEEGKKRDNKKGQRE